MGRSHLVTKINCSKLKKSESLPERAGRAQRRRKKSSTMLNYPSHPLRGPKRRTGSAANHPPAVRAPNVQREPKISSTWVKEAKKTQQDGRRSSVPSSESNRLVNPRPCTVPDRPTAIRDTHRVGHHVLHTKDENVFGENFVRSCARRWGEQTWSLGSSDARLYIYIQSSVHVLYI